MALLCPLSEKTTWQRLEQELKSDGYSPVKVRIISPPGIAPLTIVPRAYTTETGGSSTLVASQGQTLQTATMTVTPDWADGEPPVQPRPAPLRSNLMNNNVSNSMSTSIAGGQDVLSNGLFGRSGFQPAWL
jgi:hypothetical protein